MGREQGAERVAVSRVAPRVVKTVIVASLFVAAITSSYLEGNVLAPEQNRLVALEPADDTGVDTDVTGTSLDNPAATDPAVVTTPGNPTSSAAPTPSFTVPVPALPGADSIPANREGSGAWRERISSEYVMYDVGCAADVSARGLFDFFGEPLGPIKGFDGPRIYPLPDGRHLWMLQDTFIDYAGGQTSFARMDYANTTALIQDGSCFTALQRGTPTHAESFEQGDGFIDFDRYFWPGGGTAVGDTIQIFWMEMIRSDAKRGKFDGPDFYPTRTWLATYDLATLARRSFEPAVNDGVFPVYGYHVASEGEWTYLFGNSYLQNLQREGGYANGPHSATLMFLARVPEGELTAALEYWTGTGWTSDAFGSVPFSNRYFTENSMLPVLIDGRWWSATKADGFTGSGVVIDVADDPWGPYTTVSTEVGYTRTRDQNDMVTYHAFVLPFLDPSGGLIVSLSQIPIALGADDAASKYRPNFWLHPIDEI